MGEAPSVAEFFARVVPWPKAGAPGVVNLHWSLVKYDHAMGGKPFSTLVDFMAYIEVANNRPASIKDIYFCLSMQEKMGPLKNGYATAYRNKNNVAGLKSIWIDLDVKVSAYKTTEEALAALFEFCQSTGYPNPTAISFSGSGGAHIYWISDRMLTVDEWHGYAEGLKQLGIERGLKADWGCTTDSARILRVPGTFNHKSTPPKPVTLKMLAPKDLNFEEALGRFRATVQPYVRKIKDDWQTFDPVLFPKRAQDAELLTEEYRRQIGNPGGHEPLAPEPMLERCPMMAEALRTGGRDNAQPIWMLQVLATTFCHNGREVAHRISKGHKDYTPAETDEMFDRKEEEQDSRNLGWPACKTFEGFGSKQCVLCPHKDKIKSPLNLTKPIVDEATAPPFSMAVAIADDGPPEMCLPNGYKIDEKTGYIGTMISKPIGGDKYATEFAKLFRTKMKAPWRELDLGLHFKAQTERDRWKDCFIPNIDIQNDAACKKCLNRQGVWLDPDNERPAVKFMTLWMEKLQIAKDALTAVAFGWSTSEKDGLGWAYNGQITYASEKVLPAGSCDPEIKKTYTPTGDIKKWFEVLKLITDQKRPALEIIIATSFAAPLMRFTGQDGGTIVAYGDTGANKSTATALGLAVWGHPVNSKEVATASLKSLMQKMGVVHNLPLYWDDVSKPDQLERATEIASAGTEGIEGGKLTSSRDQISRGTWQTLIQINSNASLIDRIRQLSHNNAAQASRVFEYFVPLPDENTPGRHTIVDAPMLVSELRENFGRVGEKYSIILGLSAKDLRTMVASYSEKFSVLVSAQPSERFWVAICGVLITGSVLANKIGASFDLDAMQKFLFDAFLELRGRVNNGAAKTISIDMADGALTEFLKFYTENTLRTKNLPGRGRYGADKVGYVKGPTREVRVEIQWVLDARILRLSRTTFETFLNKNNYSPAMIYRAMKVPYQLKYTRADMCVGTPHQGGVEDLILLQIPENHWLGDTMHAFTSQSELIQQDPPASRRETPPGADTPSQ